MKLTASYKKAERKFWREFDKLESARRCIEAGQANHIIFRARKTNAQILADIESEGVALLEHFLKQLPGVYKQLPDGRWYVVDNNITPFPQSERTS